MATPTPTRHRATGKLWHVAIAAAPARQRWLLSALARRRNLRELPSLLRGYYPEIEALYVGDGRDYLDERSRESRSGRINGPASIFLDDKLAFHLAMPADLLPELVGIVVDGRLSTPDGQGLNAQEAITRAGRVVVRPIGGRKGRGLLFIEQAPTGFRVNGQTVSVQQLEKAISDFDYHIMTLHVEQHSYAQEIFPDTLNTLRLLMMRDPTDGEPFLAAALHRFGTTTSVPVDNWSNGGIIGAVDLGKGVIGPGAINPEGGKLLWLSRHPETAAQIEGVRVPQWGRLVDTMLAAMRAVPMIRYVGWDVVQTPDGPRVIEGNNLPDLRGTQAQGGILRDPRVARFYDHYGVLPRGHPYSTRR